MADLDGILALGSARAYAAATARGAGAIKGDKGDKGNPSSHRDIMSWVLPELQVAIPVYVLKL